MPDPAASQVSLLVVDDVEQNLLAMRALLERPGVCVLTAASGAEALELLLVHDVALALLDVQMPGMGGFELAELMRGSNRTRHVPIIFLTAAGEDQQRTFRGYEAGAVDFLRKPVEARVLETKVRVFVELQQQRQQLLVQMQELERAVRVNETMAAVLAHDLRTPLSAIVLSAELVNMRSPEGPVKQAGGRIKESAQRMSRMIEQLLDFSRIRLGLIKVDAQPASLLAICENAVAEVQQAWPEVRIALQSEGDLSGVFDADRMTQALVNLVGNAAQHGQPEGTIEVRLDGREADFLSASVRNHGELPEHVKRQLFTPFRDAESRGSSGLGLGLYIVDQFVRAHGGQVEGISSAADGTTFSMRFPRAAAQPES